MIPELLRPYFEECLQLETDEERKRVWDRAFKNEDPEEIRAACRETMHLLRARIQKYSELSRTSNSE